MAAIQCDIWQTTSGQWNVAYVKSFSKNRDNWLIPCRVLGMEPAAFLQWLIENYHPDYIKIREDGKFFSYSWTSYTKANSFKLYINKCLRQKNFTL